jgi:hypothetical protein
LSPNSGVDRKVIEPEKKVEAKITSVPCRLGSSRWRPSAESRETKTQTDRRRKGILVIPKADEVLGGFAFFHDPDPDRITGESEQDFSS